MAAEPGLDCALNWRKSSASVGNGECVEVAQREPSVLVRDSRDPSGAVLAFDRRQWRTLLTRIRSETEIEPDKA
jgi:hypothetical protein